MTNTLGAVGGGSPIEDNVRAAVKMLLAYRGRRVAELAVRLGVSKTSISNRLNGSKPFTVAEVGEMADFFDVPPSVFLAGPTALIRTGPGEPTAP